MMPRSLSFARLVAMSALLLGMALGCQPGPQPEPVPERAMPDAERSTVEVSKALGVRSNGQESVTITVTVRKADGTPLEGRKVTVSVSGEGNVVTQPARPTDTSGVATASVVSTAAGEKRVTAVVEAEGGSVPLAAQPSIQFVVLPASRLAFTASPRQGTAGVPLGAFEVAVQNADGETVTGATGTVTLALGDAPASAVLEGTLSAQVVDGVARFSELVLKRAGQGYTLVASAEGLTGATSPTFDVSGAAPASLDLAQLPGTVEAGAAVQFELSARDAFGNVAPGYTGTVRFSSDDGTAELPADYTFIAADQGRHVFPGLTLKRAGARRVEVVDTANAVPGATREVGVVAGPPAKLAFTLQPSNRSVRVPFEVAVQLRDAFDNRVAAGEPAVTLSVSESGVTLDGPLSVAPVDGEASFSGLSLSQQGTFTLKASAGAVEGTSDTFIITDDVAPATPVLSQGAITTTRITLQWTAPGDDGALGTASSYDLRYATAPIVTDADFAAALPVLISAPQVAGSAESVTLEGLTPGTTYYVALAVTDDAGNSVRSASLPVSTQDVLATSLLFTRQPQSGTAGTALPLIEVSILDQEGNVLTSSNAAVSLAVQGVGGFGPFSVAAVNGVASFDAVRIDTAGTGYRLVATSGALDAVQSDAFDVAPAEAASFEVSGVPSPVTAHSSHSPVVTAKDAFGNVVTGYSGTVHFSSDDPDAVLPGDYTFTPADLGQHAFTDALVLKTVGARTVSVADTTVPALTGTLAVTVEAAVASQLVLSGLPASVVAGETHSVTVEARDAQGNVATSYRGTVQFTSTDAAFVPPVPYTFTGADAGSKTFSVQLLTAGAQGLTVTDDSAPTPLSTTANTTVQPAAAAMLVLSAPATGTASSPFTLTVTATDAHGNVAKGYTGTVHFSSSDALATLPADYTFTGADEGSRQFSITPRQAGNSTFSVEDAGNGLPVANASVTVSPGPAVAFTLVPSQNPVDAGGSFSLQVTARDQDDNVVTGYTGTVRFASGDAAAQLPADYTFLAADNGTHSFSVVLKTAGTHALTVAEHPSGTPSASIDLQVQPGPAGRLEFRAQPANGTVRAALPEVVVAITDDHGNVIATDSTAVTVALVGGNPAASLGGTKTASPVDGLARFSDLSVDQEGTGFQLQATGGALAQASSSAFEIVDDLAPAAVSLSVASKSSSQVTLSWTAVGDDGLLGTAAEYELRYATSAIVDDASFAAATRQLVAAPQAPGSPESATVTALTPSTTYYFALKTLDGAGNAGPLVSLSATTDADPCVNVTCTPSNPTCAADGLSLVTYTSTCVDVGGVGTCQESSSSTLCPGADAVCFAGACDTAPAPSVGALSISEVMHSPSNGTTEYIELTNTTGGLLNLSGLVVGYTQGSSSSFTVTSANGAPVVVDRNGFFVLAQNGDVATNGGVTSHYTYGNAINLKTQGQLQLTYGPDTVGALTYTLDFPQTSGKAMSLSSLLVGLEASTNSWFWCDADASLAGGDFGSPGAPNGTCGISPSAPVDWCNIQYPKSFPSVDNVYPASITAGSVWTIFSQFYEPSITDRNTTTGNDSYPYVFAELGYGQDATNPEGWTWTPAAFNSGYSTAGDNDEVQSALIIPAAGNWLYGFRYRFLDPATFTFSSWTYCDQDGVTTPPAAGNYGSVTVTAP